MNGNRESSIIDGLPIVSDFLRDDSGCRYSVREKYFYLLLRLLSQEKNPASGWLFLTDERGRTGFRSYGLAPQTCKSARRKLKEDGLIECRHVRNAKGNRVGTEYRLLDDWFAKSSKAIHAAILGRLSNGVIHSAVGSKGINAF